MKFRNLYPRMKLLQDKRQCVAIGVVPNEPVIFYDWDTKDLIEGLTKLKEFIIGEGYINIQENINHKHWAIYSTKHGFHLVIQAFNWNEVELILNNLHEIFTSDYCLKKGKVDIKLLRLRTSPKWDFETGTIVSARPQLIEHCICYYDLRRGHNEIYPSFD